MEKIELGDIVQPKGRQYLLSSDLSSTYLCKNSDLGIVISVWPEIDQIELLIGGESMCAYSQQVKKFIDSCSNE